MQTAAVGELCKGAAVLPKIISIKRPAIKQAGLRGKIAELLIGMR